MRAMLMLIATASPAFAVQSPRLTAFDRVHDDGALMFHAPSNRPAAAGTSILPFELLLTANAQRPWGMNDGALWAGTGLSGRLELGATLRAGPLTLTLDPTFWFAQNAGFDTIATAFAGRSPFNHPWHIGIDLPQQPGAGGLVRVAPGRTGVRFDWRRLTLGLTSEELQWGPAVRHPILLGISAGGFPHLDVGLRPATTPLGAMEGRLVWGRLTESDWFDTVTTNDHRLFAGLLLAWQPRWLPGLTVGAQRIFYQTWTDSLGAADFFAIVQPFTKDALSDSTNPEGDDVRDQMLSLTWRWDFPSVGFEVYGEWARNDHNRDWLDFLLEPDHSQAWMFGLARTLGSGAAHSHLRTEFLHGGRASPFQVRATPTYYTHHIARQGYTERGQVLGAGPGPGSDAQYLGFDRVRARSRWGIWVERIRWYDDDYYRLFGATRRREGHNVTLELGGRYGWRVGPVTTLVQASVIRELNRHFVIGAHRWNVNAQVALRWDW